MTVENISWSISTKECCRPRRGLNPRPPGLQSDGASNWAIYSLYLEVQGTLWNTSRYPYLDISGLRNWGKQLIEQPPFFNRLTMYLTPKLEIYWFYSGKEEKLLLRSNFSSFPQYFVACCLFCCLCVKTGTRFSLRDKRLYQISEVNCTFFTKYRHIFLFSQWIWYSSVSIEEAPLMSTNNIYISGEITKTLLSKALPAWIIYTKYNEGAFVWFWGIQSSQHC